MRILGPHKPLKKVKKKKVKSLAKRKGELLTLVKKICRERMDCIMGTGQFGKCGGNIQGSHIKSEGAWKNLFIDPRNIYPMCYTHHFFHWHKDVTETSQWFILTYPKEWKYLERAKSRYIDFNNPITLELLTEAAKKGYEVYKGVYDAIASE